MKKKKLSVFVIKQFTWTSPKQNMNMFLLTLSKKQGSKLFAGFFGVHD